MRSYDLLMDPDGYDMLLRRVLAWPWLARGTRLGVLQAVHGVAEALRLPLPQYDRRGGGRCEATIYFEADRKWHLPAGGLRSYTCTDPSPLVAGLMVCWLTCGKVGREPPPELDELMVEALADGVLRPEAFGATWRTVEELFPGRACPPGVLARASISLVLDADAAHLTPEEYARERRRRGLL